MKRCKWCGIGVNPSILMDRALSVRPDDVCRDCHQVARIVQTKPDVARRMVAALAASSPEPRGGGA